MKKKEYNIEKSPFYAINTKLRASLTELKASASNEEVVLARKRYYKKDEYVKFIIEDKFDIKAYHKLSSSAKTVIVYIMYYCLEYNSPTFKLKVSDVSTVLEVDVSIIFKAIKELTDIKYIARTRTKEIYWINHNKFYKGNYIIDKFLKQR